MKAGRVTLATTPPRGMRDVLPDEVALRDSAGQQILTVYRSYGFGRIETPGAGEPAAAPPAATAARTRS